MKVGYGWSGELTPGRWTKLKIELDETDLQRLVRTAGISPEITSRIGVVDAYDLLSLEAERLLLVKLANRYGDGNLPPRAAEIEHEQGTVMTSIRLTA